MSSLGALRAPWAIGAGRAAGLGPLGRGCPERAGRRMLRRAIGVPLCCRGAACPGARTARATYISKGGTGLGRRVGKGGTSGVWWHRGCAPLHTIFSAAPGLPPGRLTPNPRLPRQTPRASGKNGDRISFRSASDPLKSQVLSPFYPDAPGVLVLDYYCSRSWSRIGYQRTNPSAN